MCPQGFSHGTSNLESKRAPTPHTKADDMHVRWCSACQATARSCGWCNLGARSSPQLQRLLLTSQPIAVLWDVSSMQRHVPLQHLYSSGTAVYGQPAGSRQPVPGGCFIRRNLPARGPAFSRAPVSPLRALLFPPLLPRRSIPSHGGGVDEAVANINVAVDRPCAIG